VHEDFFFSSDIFINIFLIRPKIIFILFVCFVPSLSSCHEKATVTLGLYLVWTKPHLLKELSIFEFSNCFFAFSVLTTEFTCLLLVQSHQAEVIIVKHLIQGSNNVYDEQ